MRKALAWNLLQGQDVCFFCAIRHSAALQAPVRPPLTSSRNYQYSAPSHRPAAAAALRVEEEEDYNPSTPNRELVGWRCTCNHINPRSRSTCAVCSQSPASNAQQGFAENKAPSPHTSQPFSRQPFATQPAITRRPLRFPNHSHTNNLPPTEQESSQNASSSRPTKATESSSNPYDSPKIFTRAKTSGQVSFRPLNARDAPSSAADEPIGSSWSNYSRSGFDSSNGNHIGQVARGHAASSSPSSGFDDTPSNFSQPRIRFSVSVDRDPSTRQRGFFQQGERFQKLRPEHQPDRPRSGGYLGERDWTARPRSADDFRSGSRDQDQYQVQNRQTRSTNQSPFRFVVPNRDLERPQHRANAGQRDAPVFRSESRTSRDLIEDSGFPDAVPEPLDADGDVERRHRKKFAAQNKDRRSRVYEINEDSTPMTNFRHSGVPAPAKRGRRARSQRDDADELEDYGTRGRGSKRSQARSNQEADDGFFDEDELESRRNRRKKNTPERQGGKSQSIRPEIHLPEFITVEKLAQALKVKLDSFLNQLEEEGYEGARYDHILDASTSATFADLYGFEPIMHDAEATQDLVARPPPEDTSSLPARPPIVTIMGHVDHGKTTILDYLRKSSVVASEHGGITQHIGAFSVIMPGSQRNITFLDTPGHAAFLDMRRRGANVTDIVVLVVAADDSVMPQTLEAIKHAREANVQIIVAITKVDKEDANVDRVKQDLARHDIVVEDYGGDYQAIPVSGKSGQGMADLEEAITLLADVADYRAETDGPVEGWIIESKVTSAGRVATVLVRRGTLRPGDFLVAGPTWARVRTLRDDTGRYIEEAPPGTPVQVDGWRGVDPDAGLEVLQADNERQAKEVVDARIEKEESMRATSEVAALNVARSEEADARAKQLEWEEEQGYLSMSRSKRPKDNEGWVEKASAGPRKVHFVIKADVAGSCEALVAAVSAIGNNEAVANVIHSGVGEVRESDIKMLAATGEVGYAISFNQQVDPSVRRLAEVAGLQILDSNIIYKVTDEVTEKVAAELPPLITQRVLGEAEIGQLFDITVKRKLKKIAGCKVTNGTISRSHSVRVSRNGEVVFTGMLESLKNVKKDVTEMRKGTECGMAFENWEDFQEGDQIQCFEEIKEKRTLY